MPHAKYTGEERKGQSPSSAVVSNSHCTPAARSDARKHAMHYVGWAFWWKIRHHHRPPYPDKARVRWRRVDCRMDGIQSGITPDYYTCKWTQEGRRQWASGGGSGNKFYRLKPKINVIGKVQSGRLNKGWMEASYNIAKQMKIMFEEMKIDEIMTDREDTK